MFCHSYKKLSKTGRVGDEGKDKRETEVHVWWIGMNCTISPSPETDAINISYKIRSHDYYQKLRDWVIEEKNYKFIAISYQLRTWWESYMFPMVENLTIGSWRYESQCQVCDVRAQRFKENACILWQLYVINVGSWLGNSKIPGLGIFPKLPHLQFPNTWASTSALGLLPGEQQPLPVWDFRRMNWDCRFSRSDLSSTWMWSSSCLPCKSNMIRVLPLWKKECNYSRRKIQNLANRS